MEEQETKIEAVIQAGRSGLLEIQWPGGSPERARMDALRKEFSSVEERWGRVRSEGVEWGRVLETVHPEMEELQVGVAWGGVSGHGRGRVGGRGRCRVSGRGLVLW